MKRAPKPTYGSLQAGRGIAALMIVLFHTALFFGDLSYWHRSGLASRAVGLTLGVDFFFVLSGAVILMAHRDDIGRIATVPTYLWKRFRRVYPIYWCVLTGVVAAYALHPALDAPWETNPRVIASGYLLVFLNTLQVNLPVAWTLFHEILFYLLFAVLLASGRIGGLLLAIWFCLSLLPLIRPCSLFCIFYPLFPLHVLFGFGMAVAWLLRSRSIPFPAGLAAAGACLFAGAVTWAGAARSLTISMHFIAGAGAALLMLGMVRLEDQAAFTVPAPLRFLGDASYSIYLIHYPVFLLCAPLLYRLFHRYPGPIFIPFALLMAIGVAAGCLMHIAVELPLLRRLPR